MITAKVIADSISHTGIRLTTLQLCYPRFIHSEFMTHRVFSRNASSSRAIPVARMISQVWSNPAMPVHWGQNQPGMQAHQQLTGWRLTLTKLAWRTAAKAAACIAWTMDKAGAHKQVANRILEPFQWIHVIVTSTEWSNFFSLRYHADADPTIRQLAIVMKDAMQESSPAKLTRTQWHLPYVTAQEQANNPMETLLKASAARCARVSYLTHEGKTPSLHQDIKLYARLIDSAPMHASPVEHQAKPDTHFTVDSDPRWSNPSMHGNFNGWIQHRKIVELASN